MLEVSHEKFIPSLIQRQFLQNDRIWFSYDEKPIADRIRLFSAQSCIFVQPKTGSFCGMKANVFVVEYGAIHGDEGYCEDEQSYFLGSSSKPRFNFGSPRLLTVTQDK